MKTKADILNWFCSDNKACWTRRCTHDKDRNSCTQYRELSAMLDELIDSVPCNPVRKGDEVRFDATNNNIKWKQQAKGV